MSLTFKAGMATWYVIVAALLCFAAFKATQSKADDGVRPFVTVQLREGYGLSPKLRPGWLAVLYHGKKWWVTPADLIPQPCVWTAPYELNGGVHGKICKLDPRDGAWVR